MSSAVALEPALFTAASHLLAGKYWQIASFTMLVYDHSLTFADEVERIWLQRISGASMLFFLNRYLTLLEFIVILDAFNDPIWTEKPCRRFVVFEGAGTLALVAICELIMIIRVYALYNRSKKVLAFLTTLWLAQITVTTIGLSTGFPVPKLPAPLFTGCILTGSSAVLSAQWMGPLITDTTIFAMTLWRTRSIHISENVPTLKIFVRDGAMYYFLIFMANLINTVIYFVAADDLKAIGASFSQLITSVMVSRLVLNLRSAPGSEAHQQQTIPEGGLALRTFAERTVGVLGEELELSGSGKDSEYFFTEEIVSVQLRKLSRGSRLLV